MQLSAATVYVVDDDPELRQTYRLLMESARLPARAYASPAEFLSDYDPAQPGCLLLDLNMPGMSALELIQGPRSQGVTMPMLVVTGHGDVASAVESMKQGVVDCLEKPVDPDQLISKIRDALHLDAILRREYGEKHDIGLRLKHLTAREQQVVRLLIAGKSNKQIAFDLGVSLRTAINHRAHIMAKMRPTNAADLTRMCMLAGFAPAPDLHSHK